MNETISIPKKTLHSYPGYYFCKNTDLYYEDANEQYLSVLGIKNIENLIGVSDYSLPIGELLVDGYRSHDRDALEGINYHILEPFNDHTGKIMFFLTYKQAYCGDNGKVKGVCCQAIPLGCNQNTKLIAHLINNHGSSSLKIHPNLFNYYGKGHLKEQLTSREIEVLYYLLQSYSAKDIARTLFLSCRTIEGHIDRLKDKLGCKKRSEIIELGKELGFTHIIPFDIFRDLLNIPN